MVKIGITGGIGSGKSVVSEILRIMNIPVYDADKASKNLLNSNQSIKKELEQILGEEIYINGNLDKKRMASLIFNNPNLLSQTNAIIHPAVFHDFQEWSKHQYSNIIACESAILFETRMDHLLDYIIMVSAPIEIRIQRAERRDKASREQILERIKNQMDDEKKIILSDFTIFNDEKQAVIPQLNKILKTLNK